MAGRDETTLSRGPHHPTRRIHITGGSGSGTTTLGAHLALSLRIPHFDTDTFFWHPTSLPFQEKRPEAERIALMQSLFIDGESWVLSGALMGWGDVIAESFDLVVLLDLAPETRMDRLARRERAAYGPRIAPGGDMEDTHRAFMAWARRYDDPGFTGRSRATLEDWCAGLSCPVLRLDTAAPVADLVGQVRAALG